VAIRITRPYANEEEYLDEELETLTRTSITLLGAQPRPQGIVLRFELVLTSGHVLARGEGRVVGFKHNAHEGLGGLTLRFTRLDSRTKTLIDKAAALREQRRPSTRPLPETVGTPVAAEQAPAEQAPKASLTPAAASIAPAPAAASIAPAPARSPIPPPLPPRGRSVEGSRGSPRPPPPSSHPSPVERETLLERLRARAKALGPEAIRQILNDRNDS
jgi:hypothetical protein